MDANERYKITDKGKGSVHKLDMNNKPDKDGVEYRIIEELENGYLIYPVRDDLSQPSTVCFLGKEYFKER